MSNLDPYAYKNGQPMADTRPGGAIPVDAVALVVGETVNSASSTITLGPGKTIASAAAGIGLAVVIGSINAIAPELFAPLGPWGPVLYAGIVAGGASLATYVTRTTVAGNRVG